MFSNYLAPDKSIMSPARGPWAFPWLLHQRSKPGGDPYWPSQALIALFFRVAAGYGPQQNLGPTSNGTARCSALVLVVLPYLTGLGMQWYPQAPLTGQYSQCSKQNLASLWW